MWISSKYLFNYKRGRIVFNVAQDNHRIHDLANALIGEAREDPELAAGVLRKIIRERKPDLGDAIIEGMQFDYTRGRWEVLATHDSFERVPFGS